jgi:hypothetical protein
MAHWQPGITLEEIEKEVILTAMRFFHNNKTHVAQALGVSIRTIQNKMAKYNGEPIEEEHEKQSHMESAGAGVPVQSANELSKKRRMPLR